VEELLVLLKPVLIPLIAEVIAYFFHRRNTDPTFLAKSDEVFASVATAKTQEEKLNASTELQKLMAM
jgi:hypothetical protein